MRRATIIATLATLVAALAVAVMTGTAPASAAPDCNRVPIPPICLHEPTPRPTPTPTPRPAAFISTQRTYDYDVFVDITVTYSSANAYRTVLEKCNTVWNEDDPRNGCVNGWTVEGSELGGATQTWVDHNENLFFSYLYQTVAYNSSGQVVAAASIYS